MGEACPFVNKLRATKANSLFGCSQEKWISPLKFFVVHFSESEGQVHFLNGICKFVDVHFSDNLFRGNKFLILTERTNPYRRVLALAKEWSNFIQALFPDHDGVWIALLVLG